MDEPTDLPEGTVIDLVMDDEGDDLDDAQREALASAITRSLQQARSGHSAPVDAIWAKLRARARATSGERADRAQRAAAGAAKVIGR